MTIKAFWTGTVAEFRKLSFGEWAVEAATNAALMNATPVRIKLEVKHL